MKFYFVEDNKIILPAGTYELNLPEVEIHTEEMLREKHIPVITSQGNRVNVFLGSIEHPMTEAHFIEWIYLKTKKGAQIAHLTPADRPEANFLIVEGDAPVEAYAFCNLHGLWKKAI